jgi:hypothetical protein
MQARSKLNEQIDENKTKHFASPTQTADLCETEVGHFDNTDDNPYNYVTLDPAIRRYQEMNMRLPSWK